MKIKRGLNISDLVVSSLLYSSLSLSLSLSPPPPFFFWQVEATLLMKRYFKEKWDSIQIKNKWEMDGYWGNQIDIDNLTTEVQKRAKSTI